jgi:hypothetical protein
VAANTPAPNHPQARPQASNAPQTHVVGEDARLQRVGVDVEGGDGLEAVLCVFDRVQKAQQLLAGAGAGRAVRGRALPQRGQQIDGLMHGRGRGGHPRGRRGGIGGGLDELLGGGDGVLEAARVAGEVLDRFWGEGWGVR